jgi:uncharacterized repeat protein (TIGR01451 family)
MPQNRFTRRTLLVLLALTFIASSSAALLPPHQALAAGSTPGPGWVKADVVGGGCVETSSGTYCSSAVTPGSPTLFEYKPDREGYPQGAGPGRQHGGDRTAELRDLCIYRGVNFGLAAGIWHHGARWTLVVRGGALSWQGPTNKHWAFEHTDSCRYDVAPTAAGPTATPYTNPQGTLVIPTNPPWTPPTPTDDPILVDPRTPTVPATATVGPCITTPVTGMGVSATQGATVYRYGTAGYYVPAAPEGEPPGTVYMAGAHTDPTWPVDLAAAPVQAGTPVDLAFDLTKPYQQFATRENPLNPFYQWGGGKVFLKVIDRGTNLGSAADDVPLLTVESDGTNPTRNTASVVENGNPVVMLTRWDVHPSLAMTGPMLWHTYEWSAARWFEQGHSTDSGRGDYAPPSDPHWARTTPDLAAGRKYIRSPGVLGIRFTPQADHTYDIVAEVEAKYCNFAWGHNYRLMRLANYTNTPPPTPVSLTSGPDVGIRQFAPRVTIPGARYTYRLIYDNTRDIPSNAVTVTDMLPDGVVFTGASPAPSSRSGQTLSWNLPPLAPPASGEILLTVQVNENAPSALLNVATIAMADDGNAANNRSEASTRVITVPAPQANFRLRIHSDLDPQQGIYTSSGTAIRWPANEVLDFAPAISLQAAPQPPDGLYSVSHRVVAWSFVQLGNTAIGEPEICKPGTEPLASETQDADLTELDGCPYRYIASPTVPDMQGMAHAYWSQTPPASMRNDVYMQTPLPAGPTELVLEYAVLTVARENGVDLDGDGSTSTVLVRKTTVTRGAFQVTLLAPRSGR